MASRPDLAALGGSKPSNRKYLRGYGGGGDSSSSSHQASHGAPSRTPAARGRGSTAEGRHNDDGVHVSDNFAYSVSKNKSRDSASAVDGSGGLQGVTRALAVANAAASPATLDWRSTRRTGTAASATVAVDESTGGTARTTVDDAGESRVPSVVTESLGSVNSLVSSFGGRRLIVASQVRNFGGASACSTVAGRGGRVPLDGGHGNCDAAVAPATRGRVGMRKSRRTYGR